MFTSEKRATTLYLFLRSNFYQGEDRIAADDDPLKLMSIAVRPLASPPFPIEMLGRMAGMSE